jgi:anaerobic selenocysteine-containing dehydrogenase/Fe-S-cluster-containing dehydrogenase component
MERRNFLKIAGAATVATALPGCTPKEPKSLIPYIIPDEEIIPGRSVMYATVCRECPAGCGMNVRVREGRATKAEGNPLHPVNRGALCARGQASLQGLYNPDRIQTPLRKTEGGGWEPISWDQAEEMLVARLKSVSGEGKGKAVAWMSPHMTGSLDALIDDWLKLNGSSLHYRYEAFNYEVLKRANAQVFGIPEIPRYDLTDVETVISFGADILETWMSPVELTGQLAQMRGRLGKHRSRLVYVGPRLSLTASNADVWLNVAPEAMGVFALSLAYVLVHEGAPKVRKEDTGRIRQMVEPFSPVKAAPAIGIKPEEISQIAKSLASSSSVVALAGGLLLECDDGLRTAAAVNLLNYICGAVGKSVDFGAPSSMSRLSSYRDVIELIASMEQGRVPVLLLSEVNPVFSLPAGDRFAAALHEVPFVVSLTSFMDETASLASLVLPLHTPLETWGDFEPYRGVHGLMQPIMEPVFGTKMLGDILLETGAKIGSAWKDHPASFSAYLKERWKAVHKAVDGGAPFETFWSESLARGGVWEKPEGRKVQLSPSLTGSLFQNNDKREETVAGACSLLVYPSMAHFDGRGANKPWLQEFPDPMTRLVWGTWVDIHPDDAARIGVHEGDAVELLTPKGKIEAGAFVTKGIRKGSVGIPMGQGHTEFGRYANGVGSNPVKLLDPTTAATGGIRWYGTMVELRKGSGKRLFASVQEEGSEHHRDLVRVISGKEIESRTNSSEEPEAPTIYPRDQYAKHHWGMVIDLDKCTGCGACVTACYAENNVPVVGREEVINGREMAWLRVDRYYDEEEAAEGSPRARFLPMLCQQCGAAPCETVCPVYAAYHTEEGLNGQVYNRCIGTRYCANNCPYKVRRFNWFGHELPSPLNWQLNPDVTVRTKGVMEKCTFCVQRIAEGKNNARMERRPVREGEIRTACEQTCPAQAITFGDLKGPDSRVSVPANDGRRAYHVLEELNTTPAVTYLKKISEPKGS